MTLRTESGKEYYWINNILFMKRKDGNKMKKKWFCYVLMTMILLCTGCSSLEKKNDVINDTVQAETEYQTNAVKTEKEPASLNVEKDTFTFDELIQLIGKKEKSALTLFDLEQKAETYKTVLFGEKVEIILETKSETIQAIQIVFGKTDQELLDNAISEQLGKDGDAAKKNVTWKLETGNVILQAEEDGCRVTIEK